ncbi:uncharacterized protein LOC143863405 [Tasmannia lanceolata]|uniref:uncharacterized protein LOC143863405 n=1 Tax=Tasmannia lanceolata TaxID=3420 RepID=UPI004063E2DC
MVIDMIVSNLLVKKTLVNNGSSADILYYHAFKQIEVPEDRLKPFYSHLYGFSGNIVPVEGSVELLVWIGRAPHHSFAMIEFLVVTAQSAYSAILGRPGQNLLRTITSAYHQKMKFITPEGIGEVKGNQTESQEYYTTLLKGKPAAESLPIEMFDLRDEAQVMRNDSVEDLENIPLFESGDKEKVVRIGSSLPDDLKTNLIKFLRQNSDVFARSPSDMPRIDPKLSVHRLNVDPTCKPVKQKRRIFSPERQKAIREEVEKLLQAEFIEEIH